MNVACKDSKGREAAMSVNVDGTNGIVIAVYDQAGQCTAMLHVDVNSARQLQHGVKACRLGAEARAVSL